MRRDEDIYDLGDVELGKPAPVLGAIRSAPRLSAVRREPTPSPSGVRPALAGSLSMFVPGLGQMVTGETAWGAFYLTWVAFCAACLWAVLVTLDRLLPTLRLLSLPPEAAVIAVVSLALLTVTLHLAAVFHAHASAAQGRFRGAAHPIVAGIASFLIPGWGQLLVGHCRRAVLFLAGVWLLGSAWLLVTPDGMRTLVRLGVSCPAAIRDGWGPVALLSAPVVLWVIAVYDAAAGAAAQRNG
jgi:TM2 domain-containing membrane protein YozV